MPSLKKVVANAKQEGKPMASLKKVTREVVIENADGSVTFDLLLTPEQAAVFFAACNAVSEELGRPVSKAEAISYMTDQVLNDPSLKH
jgi:hypothetical protein